MTSSISDREPIVCLACGKPQTDLSHIHAEFPRGRRISVGFPVCDQHSHRDLAPDTYWVRVVVEVT